MASSQTFINLSSRIFISNTVSLSTSPFSISISFSPLSQTLPLVYCGRGDRKTACSVSDVMYVFSISSLS
ncbi:hypothetical protein FRX31_005527 [Thalictrum thalictroides]|uniref:Uncharacterized protein n=1 Tax=Thalictrum thalictroides TaxID=46969 RepID=A0A7J6X740_THATH|nr:hypothetical protein FRX31_005527 [Thalictrum thalictroides]